MANFTTHIAVGTVVSGALATLTLAADVISQESLMAVTMAGVVGSVLPDIDLKESRPSRALFAGLAVLLSFGVLFSVANRYSIAEMWIAWLGTLAFIRYPAHSIFHRFSYHRGIWHSLLAGALFWFVTAIVYHSIFGLHEGVAWLAGGFMFIGFLTHLVLDEIYSVDVFDTRIKASFGTAVKLYDYKHLSDSGVVAAACALAFFATPPAKPFIEGITSPQLWAGLHNRLLPHDAWFGVNVGDDKRVALPATSSANIATGSIHTTPSAPAAGGVTAKGTAGASQDGRVGGAAGVSPAGPALPYK